MAGRNICIAPRARLRLLPNTGVSGRKPIFEMLVGDDEVKVAIQERAPATHLKRLMAEKRETILPQQSYSAGLMARYQESRGRPRERALNFRVWP